MKVERMGADIGAYALPTLGLDNESVRQSFLRALDRAACVQNWRRPIAKSQTLRLSLRASEKTIRNPASATEGAGCGFETISTGRYCYPTWRIGTWQKTCNIYQAPVTEQPPPDQQPPVTGQGLVIAGTVLPAVAGATVDALRRDDTTMSTTTTNDMEISFCLS
jgi:hypothetical protein